MREALMELMERAMAGTETISAASRADLFDAAALLLTNAPDIYQLGAVADAAANAAQAIRDAEARQMVFAALLKGGVS